MDFLWCIPVCPVATSMTYYFYQGGRQIRETRDWTIRLATLFDRGADLWMNALETVLKNHLPGNSQSWAGLGPSPQPEWDDNLSWNSAGHPKDD